MTWTGLGGARFHSPHPLDSSRARRQALNCQSLASPPADHSRHRFLGSSTVPVSNFLELTRRTPDKWRDRSAPAAARGKSRRNWKPCQAGNYRIHEDASLRKLVAYLNEYPSVIQGDFDPAFLSLPDEILVTVMRDHQKYFAVEKKNGELLRTSSRSSMSLRIQGNHPPATNVSFVRASPMHQFFWQADQRCRLADYLPKLERVTYESRLGSYRDKVERIRVSPAGSPNSGSISHAPCARGGG